MYSKYRDQDLKNMCSLESLRVPDYRRFGLERFHIINIYTWLGPSFAEEQLNDT